MTEMKTVVVGDILVQDNQERKFGAAPQYAVVWVNLGAKTIPLVITKIALDLAIQRSELNLEDIPDLGSEAAINEFDKE